MTISTLPVEVASYKWDEKSNSGYILRLDVDRLRQGLPHGFRIEDWDGWVIVNEWVVDSVDDTVHQLAQLFIIDTAQEKQVLQNKLENMLGRTA